MTTLTKPLPMSHRLRALALLPLLAPLAVQAGPFEDRERDWRNGAIVYQVIVDRFAPAADLAAKQALYPAPKTLRDWSQTPQPGPYLAEHKLSAHELDFWGGDLASLASRLDHVQQLGAEVLYLNPIHLAWTNHKYDAFDYQVVSPEYGTRDDFRRLAADARRRGLKVVLDGVFNHMGRNAPIFQDALNNPNSRWRDWFAIGPQYAGGARVWTGFQNHPELNLENPAVRRHLYAAPDSVLRSWLRDGADGWRLDTAYELGPHILRELTAAAHREKPGSLVVGEIVNYPDRWLQRPTDTATPASPARQARPGRTTAGPVQDAVMNFTLRQILLDLATGEVPPAVAARWTDRLLHDMGIEPALKSWTLIDNHDLPRAATQLPQTATRRLAQALLFTLPGSPNVYYGAEVGMTGGADPANRGPMRWDLVQPDNDELRWMKQLITLRKSHRALRVGDFRLIESQQLFAFERHTDRVLDTRLVVANPGASAVRERLMVRNADLMDDTPLVDLLAPAGSAPVSGMGPGLITVTVPPHSVLVLAPSPKALGGYSRYKRVP